MQEQVGVELSQGLSLAHAASSRSLQVPARTDSEDPHRQTLGGQNRFFCGGRCMAGPNIDHHFQISTFCAILLPSAFYFSICARYLCASVSPWLPILTVAILVSTVALWLLTACTDPGIIPRASLQLAVPDLQQTVAEATGCRPIVPATWGTDVVCDITALEEEQGFRFCPTCRIIRPPRASHCRDCDNCVLRFDHHCPFVNNCIGQRNYVFFTSFLVSIVCLAVSEFIGIGLWYSSTSGKAISQEMLALLLLGLAPAALLLPCVLVLMAFHAWLTCDGRTTKEFLGRRQCDFETPRLPGRSCETLFAFRPPSLVPVWTRVAAVLV
mmetsp:Transcript_21633/g.40748  ORF Transcript_21633/g.40748 Transcript_21633/m.40748 type:complete len:326 (+) Transcript_21633:42-1019(+)